MIPLCFLLYSVDYYELFSNRTKMSVIQVGQGGPDHSYWGRPEDMTMARPSYKIGPSTCGSDLAGETAASFASASILFKGKDDTYSATLLDHAKRLYTFADSCRGKYTDAIEDATSFYK